MRSWPCSMRSRRSCSWLPWVVPSICLLSDRAELRLISYLAKSKVKGVNARIEEFDLEGSVYNWTFLPDELIEPGLPNFAGAVRGSVNAAIFAGSGAVQCHFEADGLTVLRRSYHQMQVAAVEPEHDLSRHCLEYCALGI